MTWWLRNLFLLLITFLSSCAMQHAGMCIATVTHPGGNGRPCVIEYRVEGLRYSSFGPRMPYIAAGEHFQLLYNKQKPWKHRLLTDKQVFLENEQTAFAEGEILRCVNGTFTCVVFTYLVNGKEYRKKQVHAGPSGLLKHDKCLVQFSVENPERSILIGGYAQDKSPLGLTVTSSKR